MMPAKSKGDYIFHPDPIPPTAPAESSTAQTLSMSTFGQATSPQSASPVGTFTNFRTPAPISPGIPSTFLSGSSVSGLTSVSWGKRKLDAMEVSVVSESGKAKRSHPPSASVKAQQDRSSAMMKVADMVEDLTKTFAQAQSQEQQYTCAITLLNAYDGLSTEEKLELIDFLGMNPKEVIKYLYMDNNLRAVWMQRRLNEIHARVNGT